MREERRELTAVCVRTSHWDGGVGKGADGEGSGGGRAAEQERVQALGQELRTPS